MCPECCYAATPGQDRVGRLAVTSASDRSSDAPLFQVASDSGAKLDRQRVDRAASGGGRRTPHPAVSTRRAGYAPVLAMPHGAGALPGPPHRLASDHPFGSPLRADSAPGSASAGLGSDGQPRVCSYHVPLHMREAQGDGLLMRVAVRRQRCFRSHLDRTAWSSGEAIHSITCSRSRLPRRERLSPSASGGASPTSLQFARCFPAPA